MVIPTHPKAPRVFNSCLYESETLLILKGRVGASMASVLEEYILQP